MNDSIGLAIVASHPVQYYAPWFRHLATSGELDVGVFYLWEGTAGAHFDPGFAREIAWDVDLVAGYRHEFVENRARHPGTARFAGLHNPALPRRLRAARPDVVLALGYGWRALASLALTWRDCPLMLRGDTHLLGRGQLSLARRVPQRWLTRLLLKRYAAFAAVGVAHTDFLLAHGVPSQRIFHVPHCVDNERWERGVEAAAPAAAGLRAQLGIPSDHQVVLFAGKFEAKKQPALLLEAFRRAAPPNTSLLMVGDGPLRDELQHRHRDAKTIQWLPFQNQSAMPRIYAAADLFVLPSAGHGETWGLAVNEAMASGVPCIVSDHVGCRADLITDGRTGWSFPAGDMAALAATLSRALAILRNDSAAATLRTALAARIGNYSYEIATERLVAALRAIAGRT